MTNPARISFLLTLLTGCGFPRPPDVKNQSVSVGGTVHGMWTGADGVALRLMADGVDTLYSVPTNGLFSFPQTLVEGASYVVAVASNPTKHTCTIASGVNGVVPAEDVTSIDVACTGPAVSITPSAPEPWTFDPTHDIQPTLNASILLQEVTLTITNPDGLLTSAKVAGMPVSFGKPSESRSLPLGTITMDVDLTADGGLSKTYQLMISRGERAIAQAVYGKASNSASSFGVRVAISGDTLAVGAPGESSGATGVNGNQSDTSAPASGAVYVFKRTGGTWMQQAYIKASNTQAGDDFGASVAVDGDTLTVGAPHEDSSATSINGNQADNSMMDAGAVYVFQRSGTAWVQQAYIKPLDTEAGDEFGGSIALSGGTLAVGAVGEASSATGIDGDATSSGAYHSGAVYVFQRFSTTWGQQAYIKASNSRAGTYFGDKVALFEDTLAASAPYEASSATGVNGDQTFQNTSNAGAVYVFQRTGTAWSQQAYVKASNTQANQFFGVSVAISGNTLAIGAMGESSSATGVNGNQTDTSAYAAGAAYVFERTGATWAQQAYVKASNTERNDYFGASITLFGEILAVGANQESSNATGVGGSQTNNTANQSGAVYVFRRTDGTWVQQAYVKASNTNVGDLFGYSVALCENTLVAGAVREQSSATGIDGNQADNSVLNSGAVYVFR
jgi:hypothetical protein